MKKHYKKPTSVNKAALKTARILSTVSVGVIVTLCAFFIIKDGWEKFLQWFVGKWACLAVVIIIFAITLGLWIWWAVQMLLKVTEDED